MAQTVWHLISLHLEAGVLLILKYGIHNSQHMIECKNSCSKMTLIYRRAVEVTSRNKLLLTFQKTIYVCKFQSLGCLSYIYYASGFTGNWGYTDMQGKILLCFMNFGAEFCSSVPFLALKSQWFRKDVHSHKCATGKDLVFQGCCSQQAPLVQEAASCALQRAVPSFSQCWAPPEHLLSPPAAHMHKPDAWYVFMWSESLTLEERGVAVISHFGWHGSNP